MIKLPSASVDLSLGNPKAFDGPNGCVSDYYSLLSRHTNALPVGWRGVRSPVTSSIHCGIPPEYGEDGDLQDEPSSRQWVRLDVECVCDAEVWLAPGGGSVCMNVCVCVSVSSRRLTLEGSSIEYGLWFREGEGFWKWETGSLKIPYHAFLGLIIAYGGTTLMLQACM